MVSIKNIKGDVIYEYWGYSLKEAILDGVNLSSADLRGADLSGIFLWGANLKNADLRDANLRDADLRNANLRDANLRDADLRKADMHGANLKNADLKDADLKWANLDGVKGIEIFYAGNSNRQCITYTHKNIQYYKLGCFNGTYEETIEAIRKKYGNKSKYEKIVTAYYDQN